MRLAGIIKGGYYPAPPQAIDIAMKQLIPPASGQFTICDFCCGQGLALSQIAEALKCSPKNVYGCELSGDLGQDAKANLPGSTIVTPADFFNLSCTSKSFSMLWLNPPFDTNLDSRGRAEFEFLKLATEKLCIGGVLVFVVPQATAERWDVQKYMIHNYKSIYVVEFPERHRKFNEVVMFGVRVDPDKDSRLPWKMTWTDQCSLDPVSYQIPSCKGPASFRKVVLTDGEILEMSARSSARSILSITEDPPLARPPLALGEGHIALLVASGHLDGLIEPPNESSHVVRGMSKKVEFIDSVEDSEDDGGNYKTTTVLKQRIVIAVRAIGKDGVIKSFTDQKDNERDIGETKFDVPAEGVEDDVEIEESEGEDNE